MATLGNEHRVLKIIKICRIQLSTKEMQYRTTVDVKTKIVLDQIKQAEKTLSKAIAIGERESRTKLELNSTEIGYLRAEMSQWKSSGAH